jgi:hypothetical protein
VVSAAPNRTALVARVEARRPHPSVGRWDVLSVRVESSAPVEGYRDMVAAEAGRRLEVAVDRDRLPADVDLVGRTVRLTASVAGPGVLTAVPAGDAATVRPE